MKTVKHTSSAMISASPPPMEGIREKYLYGPSEGEHLIHFRDHGIITIKISSSAHSGRLTLATQQVPRGSGIPLHRHLHMDEIFHVMEGNGEFTMNDLVHRFEKGTTIFIPQNAWHCFQNPDNELVLLWIAIPAGLEDFFRETCHFPGDMPKHLTREQIEAIALEYGTEYL